jgi:cytochrome P450
MTTSSGPATAPSCDYLAVLDAAEPVLRFPLVRRWMDGEPLPFFKALRERRPVLVTPVCTLVAGFDAVMDVLRQPRIYTTALYRPKMGDGIFFMCHDDDALHTREKSLMQAVLSRDDLPAVRALVGRLARTALDGAAGRRMDAIAGYTRMVPARLVQEYFGLTGREPEELMEWSYWNQVDTFHNLPFDLLTDEQRARIVRRHDETGEALGKYVGELVVARLAAVELQMATSPLVALHRWLTRRPDGETAAPALSDDIVARLLRSHFPGTFHFDIRRLGVNVGGLLIGTIETTSPAVAAVINFLLERPALREQAIACARLPDPGDFDAMVWEALRFVPISPYLFRETAAAATLAPGTPHATPVPPGTLVLALTQSAMFDPRAGERPDEYLPGRNWYNSFHFGYGSHECLGRYIGMVMIPEMVRQIVLRPGLAAEGPMDYGDGPFPRSWPLRWEGDPVEGNQPGP